MKSGEPPERKMKTRHTTHMLPAGIEEKDSVFIAVCALEDLKGQDIVTLPLTNSYADHLIVATGTSSTHIQALADRVEEYLQKAGHAVESIEGIPGEWAIVDAGDVVVHIFTAEKRDVYRIEKLHLHDDAFED